MRPTLRRRLYQGVNARGWECLVPVEMLPTAVWRMDWRGQNERRENSKAPAGVQARGLQIVAWKRPVAVVMMDTR